MALNSTTLKNAMEAAFLANLTSSKSQTDQVSDMAQALADAMQAFVESATITYTTGLIAPGGSGGPVTGTFTNIIS